MVSPFKRRSNLVLLAMRNPPVKSSLGTNPRSGLSKSLRFATFMKYDVYKGYKYCPNALEVLTIREAGYDVHSPDITSSDNTAFSPPMSPSSPPVPI